MCGTPVIVQATILDEKLLHCRGDEPIETLALGIQSILLMQRRNPLGTQPSFTPLYER